VGPDSGLIDSLAEVSEQFMPDECHLLTADTATDVLGERYATGTYTLSRSIPCRWRELSGRELEIARSFAETATHQITLPKGTPATVGQRVQVYQDGVLTLTCRVVWVGTGSYAASVRLICQETNE
jgi:hypothetical protein